MLNYNFAVATAELQNNKNHIQNFRMWFKFGLKAQKLLAQGIALGIIAISKAPCKGKSLVNTRFFKAFALTGRQGCVHNNPGRCPGLGASALSGRVERNLRKLKTSSLFAAGFKRLEL